jgi:hypothetical protein
MPLHRTLTTIGLASLPLISPAQAQTKGAKVNTVLIVNANSSKCKDNPYSNTSIGTPIQQFTCHGDKNQRWQLVATKTQGEVMIKSALGNLCMAPFLGFKQPRNEVALTTCDRNDINNIWTLNANGDKYTFINKNSKLCLSVKDQILADESRVMQDTCDSSAVQAWTTPLNTSQANQQDPSAKPTPLPVPNPSPGTGPAPTPTPSGGTISAHTQPLSKTSKWSNRLDLGLSATSMAVLGSGKVLIWAGYAEKNLAAMT